jgi:tyrosine-specific transport protein
MKGVDNLFPSKKGNSMRSLSGALLVSGTAIGAGMLALPVVTGLAGFLPVAFLFFLCGLFMAATGLLLLEVCMWMPPESNLLTMAYRLLGRKGFVAVLLLYLFLFYCLTIAYVAGGGGFIASFSSGALSLPVSIVLFTLIFSPAVFLGVRAVNRLNLFLMCGLVLSYFAFILMGMGYIDTSLLGRGNMVLSLLSMPVVFTSFSFQGTLPSLVAYLKRNTKAIRWAIIFGTMLPFLVYTIWEMLILGIVPLERLTAASASGYSAVEPLKEVITSPYLYPIGQAFAFFALTTSFLGVTLGLFDFLSDLFQMAKIALRKELVYLLVFLPPTLIALFHPHIFIKALTYAGGIGCALLLGAMPALFVWVGRYRKGYGTTHQQIGGGKPLLILILAFALLEVAIELYTELL